MKLNTIEPEEVDEALVSLRYKHYQHRLMDKINRALVTRKQIKVRLHNLSNMQRSVVSASQPNIHNLHY